MLFSISQHALHGRPLRLRNHRLEGVSLFPFFDLEGRTQALMCTTEESGKIVLLNFQDGLFARGGPLVWLKPHRLGLRYPDLRDCGEEGARSVAHLWHFDPWWKLMADRYQDHPAVPFLKGTNLPGFDARIRRMWFHKSLDRVTWVGRGEGEAFEVQRFQPEVLATADGNRGPVEEVGEATAESTEGWRLRPFWQGG